MEIWFDNEKPALIYFISCFFFFKEPFLVKPIPTEIQPIPDRIYKPKKKYTFHSRNTVCKFIFLIIDILVETAKKIKLLI